MNARNPWLVLAMACGGLWWGSASQVFAQSGAVNPYAADPNLAASDAVWPPHYKPPVITAWEAVKYQQGWCLMDQTKITKYERDPNRFLDVNKLPKVNISGRVAATSNGMLAMMASDDTPKYVFIHDNPAISAVRVKGTALPAGLRKGQYVKFQGAVNAKGQVAEPIQEMELAMPPKAGGVPQIIADKKTIILAQVVSNQNGKLTLTVPTGKIRSFTATVDEHAKITVNIGDFKLAGAEDKITVTGRIYKAETGMDNVNATKVDEIFALDVEIEMTHPLGAESPKESPAKPVVAPKADKPQSDKTAAAAR